MNTGQEHGRRKEGPERGPLRKPWVQDGLGVGSQPEPSVREAFGRWLVSLRRSPSCVVLRGPEPPYSRILFSYHDLVDGDLSALFDANHFVDRLEARQGYIHDVVPRAEHDVNRGEFIQHPLVDGNLRTFRLGVNADRSHACRAVAATMAKQLVELADGLHVLDVAERPESRRILEILARAKVGGCGFFKISLLA